MSEFTGHNKKKLPVSPKNDWFGISTIVGCLMPNPFYTYIKYIISKPAL